MEDRWTRTALADYFPRRNRIISGLSRAVVVVEAAAKSGSLITAEMALEQGREVFAVPGHPFDARATGCNRLIRDGATLLRGAQDVLDVISGGVEHAAPEPRTAAADPAPAPIAKVAPVDIPSAPAETRTLAETAALHQLILDRLGPSPVSEDQLVRDLAMPAGDVASELTDLELEGHVSRAPGGLISRTG